MDKLAFLNHDPQDCGAQYLDDLASAYWFSEAIFSAVELEIFTYLAPSGRTLTELAAVLQLAPEGLGRFLPALQTMGLVDEYAGTWFNTKIARRFLLKGEPDYQGDSILWRKSLLDNWQGLAGCLRSGTRTVFLPEVDEGDRAERFRRYSRAMDCVARQKAGEILSFFAGIPLRGKILAVGSGAGAVAAAFLSAFPVSQATLLDLEPALAYTEEINGCKYGKRLNYCPGNILAEWPVPEKEFELVILSNTVHTYGEAEISSILSKAAACLKPGGLMLIHDVFFEHFPVKAALFDLNMLVNIFNGRIYSAGWIRDELKQLGLASTRMLPLSSDTAIVVAAAAESGLAGLALDEKSQLAARIRDLGFHQADLLPTEMIHVPDWTPMHCRFGCSSFGEAHCPPHSPSPEKTRLMLQDYSTCLLLSGDPPTAAFQRQVLQAEKEAFKSGYYKAFAFWAGPCSICQECSGETACKNTKEARPSMEASGIDVFATVRRAGISLRTVASGDDYVKYFAILLLE